MINKERKLIADLLNAGIIDAEENKKAELYLSLSSQTFDTHQGAIDWLIQNRAVRRERQDQVREAFSKANLDALTATSEPVPDITSLIPDVNNVEPPSHSLESQGKNVYHPTDRSERSARSYDASPIESIYHYNLKQLDRLVSEYPRYSAVKQTTKDKFENCPYLFCDLSELEEWITSDYTIPVETALPDELIDSTTALQLYSLVKQGLIAPDEYDECYFHLLDESSLNNIQLPFSSEDALLNNLIENNCLNHALTDRHLIKSYNRNMLLVRELVEKKALDKLQVYLAKNLLENEPELRFDSSQQLLEWFTPQDVTQKERAKKRGSKKKKVSVFFIIFLIYVAFRIITGIYRSDDKPKNVVVPPSNQSVATFRINCSDNQVTSALQKKVTSESRLSDLGKMKKLSRQKNLTGATCRASAAFENGTADVIFHVASDKNTSAMSITDIVYSNIKIDKPAAAEQTASSQANDGNRTAVRETPVIQRQNDSAQDKNANVNVAENSLSAGTGNNATGATKNETAIGVKYDNNANTKDKAATAENNSSADVKNETAIGVKYDNNVNTKDSAVIVENDNTAGTQSADTGNTQNNTASGVEPTPSAGLTENNPIEVKSRHVAQNEYEAVVLKNLEEVDRLMAQRSPGSLKLLDIISNIKLSGQCKLQTHNNVTMCPFTVYYKDVWMKKDTIRNYKINVKFISENKELKLESQVDFIKKLTDEMYNNYRKSR